MTCRFEDCRRKALPDQSRCEDHRLRWLPRESAERTEPEWLIRRRTIGLPAKDMTAA